jgi:hypothetical protein
MQVAVIRPLAAAALVALAVVNTACVHRPPTLYGWGSYQAQVYAHFKASSGGPELQIQALEADLQKIHASNATPAPGYYAHMGMLYASLGRDDQAVQAFNQERTLFPESAKYLDFLMSKAKKSK